ncbi:hypothetical protein CHUAL_012672 [Chamberlinius hualienensis]
MSIKSEIIGFTLHKMWAFTTYTKMEVLMVMCLVAAVQLSNAQFNQMQFPNRIFPQDGNSRFDKSPFNSNERIMPCDKNHLGFHEEPKFKSGPGAWSQESSWPEGPSKANSYPRFNPPSVGKYCHMFPKQQNEIGQSPTLFQQTQGRFPNEQLNLEHSIEKREWKPLGMLFLRIPLQSNSARLTTRRPYNKLATLDTKEIKNTFSIMKCPLPPREPEQRNDLLNGPKEAENLETDTQQYDKQTPNNQKQMSVESKAYKNQDKSLTKPDLTLNEFQSAMDDPLAILLSAIKANLEEEIPKQKCI